MKIFEDNPGYYLQNPFTQQFSQYWINPMQSGGIITNRLTDNASGAVFDFSRNDQIFVQQDDEIHPPVKSLETSESGWINWVRQDMLCMFDSPISIH